MGNRKGSSVVKKLLIGGLFLIVSACSTPNIYTTNNYETYTIPTQTKKLNVPSDTKNKEINTLIVLSPHFDDAVLSVGGIISEFDGPKYIVTFFSMPTTTAEYLTNWDKRSGFNKSTDAREIREQENNSAANRLGANVINFDYVDNQYDRRSSSDNSSLVEWIAKDIEQVIESMNNSHVTVIGPSYFGDKKTHADHLLVSKAFAQAVKNKCYAKGHFYFYEDQPYTQKKFADGVITLDKILTDFYTGINLDKGELFISEQAFNSKLDGIRLYSSQLKAFTSLGMDIIESITYFEMNRCPQFPLPQKPCEVIYEIK